MNYFIILIILFTFQSCSKLKTVLICGDHVCVNKAEAEQFFEENLTIEVKILDKNKKKKIDLVKLNLINTSKLNKKISIEPKISTKKDIKILTNDEIKKIRKDVINKEKRKKIIKKNEKINPQNDVTSIDKENKILNEEKIALAKKNVNYQKKKVVDVCTIIKKCSIDEITKYLLKQGKKKDYPDITTNQ